MAKWLIKLAAALNQAQYDKDAQYDLIKKAGSKHGYTENITGDACVGDQVLFARATFTGSFRKPKFDGYEVIHGVIIKDSYGAAKQQHTFTIQMSKTTMRIKGRNLYSVACFAKPRPKEERQAALDDKHKRGDEAREARDYRKSGQRYEPYI